MASIVQRKDRANQWCVYFRDATGAKRGKYFPHDQKRAAKKFAAQMDATAGTARETIDLATAVVTFIEDKRLIGTAPATTIRYQCVLILFAQELGEKTPLDRITTQAVNDWRNRRLAERQRSTVRNDCKCLGCFFNWCIARGWLHATPMRGVEIPRVKETIKPFLLPEAIDKFIAAARAQPRREFYLLAVLCADAGLRRNEAIQLPWACVDFERRLLLITGKSKRPRPVPMTPLVYDALMDWGRSGPLVFPPIYKTANLRSPHLAKEFNAWIQSLALPIHSMKALRDSFATRLLIRGAPGRVAADLLGHSDERTTRIYQQVVLDHARSFVSPDSTPSNQPPKSAGTISTQPQTETPPAPAVPDSPREVPAPRRAPRP